MPVPVYNDGSHGMAIACLAALLNALEIVEKNIANVKIVFIGAGVTSLACMKLIIKAGAKIDKCFACDTNGVIWAER